MSRKPLFDLKEGEFSLNLNSEAMSGGIPTIAEEEEKPASKYIPSAAEMKEHERRRKQGKVKLNAFTSEQMNNDADVIQAGENILTIREQDELTVEIKNLSDGDRKQLMKMRLKQWSSPKMLSEPIQMNLTGRFRHGPTTIQSYVIPLILKTSKDIYGRAQTGSGKSAAYLLPIIERIYQAKKQGTDAEQRKLNSQEPYAVVFLPTRELCLQVFKEARRLIEGTNVRVTVSFGGMEMGDSYRMMRQFGADIVIGTPSRLSHLFFGIEQNEIHKACFDLTNLKYLVLDEADRIVDLAEFCTYVVPFKNNLKNKEHSTYMFSATDTDCESGKRLFVADPIEIVVGGDEGPVSSVLQEIIQVDPRNPIICNDIKCIPTKLDVLLFLLERDAKKIDGYKRVPPMVVFVATRRQSDSIAIYLLRKGFRAMSSNSDRSMKCRMDAVNGIQSGKYDILIATDVFARGLNVPNLQTVINFSLPLSCHVNYIHRIGRTGRMGNVGRAISFFNPCTDYDIAPFLEKCLKNNGHEVPKFLSKISFDIIERIDLSRKNYNAPTEYINGVPALKSVLPSDVRF